MIHDRKDKLLQTCGVVSTLFTVTILLSIYAFIAGESLPIWRDEGILSILLSNDWQPLSNPPQVGFLTMVVSTLWSALGAMLIATPFGIFCGVFLSEYAPAWLSSILRAVLYMLTGVPSVVYGFLGASMIVPWYEKVIGLSSGESLFCASLILSIMVIPYIVSGTYGAFQSISSEYREAGYGLGVSKEYILMKIVAPLACRNMISAVTLAFGRAAGETMAVLMLAGNTLTMPLSWFSKGEPLSALIALEIGTAEVGGRQYQGLFAAGLILLLIVSSINFFICYHSSRGKV
ncbi:MAG: phosphate transporter rane protein 1, PhoT family [Firmicutes bacterium]|nr:phosphate transporter rane protein 1, PhoT family [Bacillota bacterium]